MRAAIYVRVSTDKQSEGLESQRRALLEHASSKNYEYTVFSDEDVSGKTRSRPGLDAMLKAVRRGEYDSILVYSFSRFARNTKMLLNALEEFDKLKVGFVSLSESIDTTSPVGRAMFAIVGALAQLEREQGVERVKAGMHNARMSGKQIGRPKLNKDREILQLAHQGLSLRKIATQLKISKSSVHKALQKSA